MECTSEGKLIPPHVASELEKQMESRRAQLEQFIAKAQNNDAIDFLTFENTMVTIQLTYYMFIA